MIGQVTFEEAKDHIEARELDLINVVGKADPVPIFELLAKKGELAPEKAGIVEAYHRGFKMYQEMQFADAMKLFSENLLVDKDDGPSKTMIKRCEYYMNDPPPENWNGAFVMTSK